MNCWLMLRSARLSPHCLSAIRPIPPANFTMRGFSSWARRCTTSSPGDCIPKAYEYSWNDEILAANEFAAIVSDATGGIASQMDTQAKGIPLVVYNPLAITREDAVEATVEFPGEIPKAIQVIGPDGKPVLSQILSQNGSKLKIAFLANVPSVSFSTFDVQPAAEASVDPSGQSEDHRKFCRKFSISREAERRGRCGIDSR